LRTSESILTRLLDPVVPPTAQSAANSDPDGLLDLYDDCTCVTTHLT
jgi:hypothetical protein